MLADPIYFVEGLMGVLYIIAAFAVIVSSMYFIFRFFSYIAWDIVGMVYPGIFYEKVSEPFAAYVEPLCNYEKLDRYASLTAKVLMAIVVIGAVLSRVL